MLIRWLGEGVRGPGARRGGGAGGEGLGGFKKRGEVILAVRM